jgi:hypothetical protein
LNWDRKFYLTTVAALFFAGLGIYLGLWQLSRAAQKEALQAAMQTQAGGPGAFARFDLNRVPSPAFVVDEVALVDVIAVQ